MKIRRKTLAIIVALSAILLTFGAGSAAWAASSGSNKGEAISSKQPTKAASGNGSVRPYSSDGSLQVGSIVQLGDKSDNTVKAATREANKHTYGVIIDPNLLPVTITSNKYKHRVYVASAGSYDVLVSTQGGPIKAGDYITVSSINGVGMNVNEGGAYVVGRAVRGFDGKSNLLGHAQLKEDSGNSNKEVAIGLIPIIINVQRNPNRKSTEANLPNFLERAGQAIANKPVSHDRLYFSAAVAALSIIIAITILYVGIRSSIISIGRNPLSKKAIYREMMIVIIAGILVLIIGLFAVYLLLKL